MSNYHAIGEFVSFQEQAKDAGYRRSALLHNLSGEVRRYGENPHCGKTIAGFRAALDEIEAAERELAAAIQRVNQAADLCGKQRVSADDFIRPLPR